MAGTFLSDTHVLTSLSPRWGWGRESLPAPQGPVPKEHNKGEFSAGWQLLRQQVVGDQGTLSYFGSYVVGGVLEGVYGSLPC